MLVKNKDCVDYTNVVKTTYNLIRKTYSYSARIINIWEMLKKVFFINEFELLTPELYNNANFESYLIDRQIDLMNGKDVDFGEIYEAILTVGDFTAEEKRMMVYEKIEEILWGIFLAICNPDLKFN